MTETTFAIVANMLSAMPASSPWNDVTATVYALAMKDWDDELAQKTVMKALMTKKWRPAPSELREIALQIKKIKVPTSTVYEQVKHIVIYHPAEERKQAADRLAKTGRVSPMLNEIVSNAGGWRAVGNMTEEELAKAIDKEMDGCLESESVDKLLSMPLPQLEATKTVKMIGQ